MSKIHSLPFKTICAPDVQIIQKEFCKKKNGCFVLEGLLKRETLKWQSKSSVSAICFWCASHVNYSHALKVQSSGEKLWHILFSISNAMQGLTANVFQHAGHIYFKKLWLFVKDKLFLTSLARNAL